MINRFEDMTVWQDSQTFAVDIYSAVKTFPLEERYGLIDQMRRASSSVSANIAEGFGRSSNKDKLHFYHIALGSLLETKNFVYLAGRLDYIDKKEVNKLVKNSESVESQIRAIMKYFKDHA